MPGVGIGGGPHKYCASLFVHVYFFVTLPLRMRLDLSQQSIDLTTHPHRIDVDKFLLLLQSPAKSYRYTLLVVATSNVFLFNTTKSPSQIFGSTMRIARARIYLQNVTSGSQVELS